MSPTTARFRKPLSQPKTTGLIQATGANSTVVASLLHGAKLRAYVIDKNFKIIRADGPMGLLLGNAIDRELHIPGASIFDSLEEAERPWWRDYLSEIMNEAAKSGSGYTLTRHIADDEGGQAKFVCISPQAILRDGAAAGVRFMTLEIS